MGYRGREERAKDHRRRENLRLRDEFDAGETRSREPIRDRYSVNPDAALMNALKDSAERDSEPGKNRFIGWLKEKRWGQFFTPAHFHAALGALTPTGYRNETVHEPLVRAGDRLAANFLRCSETPKPFENAGILYAVARLGINNKECVEKCLEYARYDLPATDIHDLSLYLYALDRLTLTKPHHRDLVRGISARLCELLREEKNYSKKLVSCAHHLSRYRVHHARIFSSIAEVLKDESDKVSLGVSGMFARATTKVNWYSPDYIEHLGNKTLQGILEGRPRFLESGAASGLAGMIRAPEAHTHPIPESLLRIFSARCEAGWDAYSIHDQTLIAGQFAPVLLGRGLSVPVPMVELLGHGDSFEGVPRNPTETIEDAVSDTLTAMSLSFEHGAVRHSFELDFLIQAPGRAPVNLEIDGIHCHTIEVLDGTLAPGDEIPRSQAFRDRVLERLGYQIIRLPVTEWLATGTSEKQSLIRRALHLD